MSDNQNRLLAMLNQAASAAPPKASPPHQASSSSSSHLNPPSGAVREPSPLPPPPAISSLNDLFKNITSPPPQQPGMPGAASPPVTSPGGNVHQNKLLGMLASVGQNGHPAPPSAPVQQPVSPLSTVQTPLGSDQQVNLLNLFKSPSLPTHEPIITHPSQPPVVSPPQPPAQQQQAQPSSTTAARPGPPSKSPFDFVSPFDVFDKAPAKPDTLANGSSSRTEASPKSAHQQQQQPQGKTSQHFAVPPAQINGTVIHPGEAQPRKKEGSSLSRTATNERSPHQQPSPQVPAQTNTPGSTSASTRQAELNLPWKVSAAAQTKGPMALQSATTIDFSKLGDDALVKDDVLQTDRITNLKSETIGYTAGRSVAITANWYAYGLSKGRARLIDNQSAAKLALEPRASSIEGPIIDIAVTPTLVAIVSADSSITVFRVPERWHRDDPECQEIAYISSPSVAKVFRVEWVIKGSASSLTIGTNEGVAIIDPDTLSAGHKLSVDGLLKTSSLKVQQDVLAYCLNQSQAVMALLSATELTLYNMSTRKEVWHKTLPTSFPNSIPSSIQFCESNVLIGRDNNTIYELLQLTGDLAVLSSIRFTAPEPSSPDLNYTHALYDSYKSVLWVAAPARASLMGFRYALKGASIIKDASSRTGSIVAFDQVAEYSLDSVTSMALHPASEQQTESSIFFATPTGLSVVSIDHAAVDVYGPPPPAPASAPSSRAPSDATKTPQTQVVEKKDNTKAAAKGKQQQPKQTPVQQDEKPDVTKIAAQPIERSTSQAESTGAKTSAPAPAAATPSELPALLKQTEDRLINRIKQNIDNSLGPLASRSDSINSAELANEVSAKVEKQVKAALQQEIKKSLVPAAASSIAEEVRSVAPAAIQSSLSQSLNSLPRDVERSLATTMPRLVGSTIQPAIERVLHDTIKQTLIPALADSSDRLADHITREFKSEMVQIRKDFNAPTQNDNDHLLQSLIASVSALQKQVEQLSKAPPPAAPPAPPVPAPAPPASSLNVEDTFLTALSETNPLVALPLVNDFWGVSEYILPMSADKKPAVSQSVILALLHKLARCSVELNPNDSMLARVLTWERRVAVQYDSRDPMIARYGPQVLSYVYADLDQSIQTLSRQGGDLAHSHVGQIRAIVDILRSKPAA